MHFYGGEIDKEKNWGDKSTALVAALLTSALPPFFLCYLANQVVTLLVLQDKTLLLQSFPPRLWNLQLLRMCSGARKI